MPSRIISGTLTSQSSPEKTCLPPVSASTPLHEHLVMAIYLLIQFAKFLKVLANHQQNPSTTFVLVKLPSAADVFMPILERKIPSISVEQSPQ
jgi:hypothetical protein